MILKGVVIAVVVLAAIVGLIFALGASLPRTHSAQSERLISAPAERVAARIRVVRDYPSWRDVTVEEVREGDDGVSYVEVSHGDKIAFRIREVEPGQRFVSVITDETLPFGGQWTWTVEPHETQTLVRIQEDGEIKSPVFRFFARYVFGYEATMRAYLDALEKAETS